MKSDISIFIKNTIIFLVIFLLLGFIYSKIVWHFSDTPLLTQWPKEAFELKEESAKRKQSPKIILLGGSDVMLGLSAKHIEEKTGIPTVNFAVWAELKDYTFHIYLKLKINK
jgi:hypothetical protein